MFRRRRGKLRIASQCLIFDQLAMIARKHRCLCLGLETQRPVVRLDVRFTPRVLTQVVNEIAARDDENTSFT